MSEELQQKLRSQLWTVANTLRGNMSASDFMYFTLGFIFYKYLSEKIELYANEELKEDGITFKEAWESDDEELKVDLKEACVQDLGYFVEPEYLYSTIISMIDRRENILPALERSLKKIEDSTIGQESEDDFGGLFSDIDLASPKLGKTADDKNKLISDVLVALNGIDFGLKDAQEIDILGDAYEYMIGQFAAGAGKKAGEFYTPHEVSLLMSEIVANHLKDRDKIEIYDPTSGSGSLLINIGKSASKYIEGENKVKYYAQELKQNTYNLTRMNLIMRGIEADNIVTRNGDTLEDDWPYFDENDPSNTYNPLYVDAVVSNPPYSQAWNSADKETDPRYAGHGLAPKGKADYAFLLHDLYHIKPDGIMTIVLPHGVLFRGGEEGEIRKNLIEKNKIDTIIGLPANIFYGTGIPTIIMVLKQKRTNTDVLIIDASKGFVKEGKNNKLRASDIKRIVDVVTGRESIEKFSRVVSRDEIRTNDYNLNIPRYVDSSEAAESWDIYASMFGGIPNLELDKLKEYWKAFPTLRSDLFENTSAAHCRLKIEDVKKAIKEHTDVKNFESKFQGAFGNFDDYLYDELIAKMEHINISKTEEILSENIFERMADIPLVDR